jgi:cobalt-zinc-cadmium resistance protein CzcA
MFERIIRFSIEQRWLILLAVFGMAALGVFQLPEASHRRRA